jgi:signal peptidase II
MKKLWPYLVTISFLIIIDQITKGAVQANFNLGQSKKIIDGFFNFTYVQNPGAAFGFLANAHESIRKPLFLFIPVLACFWLVVLLWKTKDNNLILSAAYTLILAGAVGNLIDRFSLGYVVDFFDFYVGDWHFPAFNVADSCITVAAFLLIWDFICEIRNKADIKNASDAVPKNNQKN